MVAICLGRNMWCNSYDYIKIIHYMSHYRGNMSYETWITDKRNGTNYRFLNTNSAENEEGGVRVLGPVGPRCAECWPHKPCYQGRTQDNSYLSNTPNKLFPRQVVPRTRCNMDDSYPSQLVPETTRTQDNSYPEQLVHKTIGTQCNPYQI